MGRMKDFLIGLEENGISWDDYVSQCDDLRKAIREEALLSPRVLPEGYGKAEELYLTALEASSGLIDSVNKQLEEGLEKEHIVQEEV